MDSYIARLFEIETAAEAIVLSAESQKATLEKEMQTQRDEFDKMLEADTDAKINVIREDLKKKMSDLLDSRSDSNKEAIKKLQDDFEKNHHEYAKTIFEHIIEV